MNELIFFCTSPLFPIMCDDINFRDGTSSKEEKIMQHIQTMYAKTSNTKHLCMKIYVIHLTFL